jgi:hypothetical protein
MRVLDTARIPFIHVCHPGRLIFLIIRVDSSTDAGRIAKNLNAWQLLHSEVAKGKALVSVPVGSRKRRYRSQQIDSDFKA